jgi:hypothetical protein
MSSETSESGTGDDQKDTSRPRTRSRSRTRSRTRDVETGRPAAPGRGGDAGESSAKAGEGTADRGAGGAQGSDDDRPRRQGRGNQRRATGKSGSGKGGSGKGGSGKGGSGKGGGGQGQGRSKAPQGKGSDGKEQGAGSEGKDGKSGKGGGGKDGGQKGSGGKGGRSRSRRGRGRRSSEGAGFWGSVEKLPEARDDLRITDDPSAVPRSLGPPPLPGHEVIAEHYFAAVYDRAVTTAGALGAAGGLIDANTLAEELGEE